MTFCEKYYKLIFQSILLVKEKYMLHILNKIIYQLKWRFHVSLL
jgi:hypothetical protein